MFCRNHIYFTNFCECKVSFGLLKIRKSPDFTLLKSTVEKREDIFFLRPIRKVIGELIKLLWNSIMSIINRVINYPSSWDFPILCSLCQLPSKSTYRKTTPYYFWSFIIYHDTHPISDLSPLFILWVNSHPFFPAFAITDLNMISALHSFPTSFRMDILTEYSTGICCDKTSWPK